MSDLDAIRARDAADLDKVWDYYSHMGMWNGFKPFWDEARRDRRDLLAALDAALARERRLREALKQTKNAMAYSPTTVEEGKRPHWCRFPDPQHETTCRALMAIQDEARAALAETPEAGS